MWTGIVRNDEQILAPRIARLNLVASLVACTLAAAVFLESSGSLVLFGSTGREREGELLELVGTLTCATLGVAAILHLNLAAQAMLLLRRERERKAAARSRSRSHLPVVQPIDSQSVELPTASGGTAGGGSAEDAAIVDDGRRVQLDPSEKPADDRTYVMYHGTHPRSSAAPFSHPRCGPTARWPSGGSDSVTLVSRRVKGGGGDRKVWLCA
jgi:hypothetical protein